MKILAIGNSFSLDGMEHIYQVAENLGEKEIILGDLYIGGCSLQRHSENVLGDLPAYEYYFNDSGEWHITKGTKISDVINQYDWDYVSLQQVSGNSGRPETYEPYLTIVMDYVRKMLPNTKFLWHMTWAYPQHSDSTSFAAYDYNQMKMYTCICNTVQKEIVPRSEFKLIVPDGTAIQNARTSFYGDNFNRDAIHLSYDKGRYVAALMWVKSIFGLDIDNVTWTPKDSGITPRLLLALKEAVDNAFKNPFAITESSYKTEE